MLKKLKLSKLVSPTIYAYFIEYIIFKLLSIIGVERKAVKIINTIETEKKDVNYKTYRQYMDRRQVFNKILSNEQMTLLKDLGEDSLFLARHYIHQKRENVEKSESFSGINNYNALSPIEFKNLIIKLFQSMGYVVSDAGSADANFIKLLLDLSDQKLLVFYMLKDTPNQIEDLQLSLQAQKELNCNGTIQISTQGFSDEAIKFANANYIALMTKNRLSELLKQYLSENWD